MAGLLAPCCLARAEPPLRSDGRLRLAQAAPNLSAAMAEYRRKLEIYQRARDAFDAEASAYWTAISDKRKLRFAKRREKQVIGLDDYVLTQPPLYTGPSKPVDPSREDEPGPPRKPIPVVEDFLQSRCGAIPIRAAEAAERD